MASKPVHLDCPEQTRLWSCKFPVRTACAHWISNESGVTTNEALVTCRDCKSIIANRGQLDLLNQTSANQAKHEQALKVAAARRAAIQRKKDKAVADIEARDERLARAKETE